MQDNCIKIYEATECYNISATFYNIDRIPFIHSTEMNFLNADYLP